MTPLILSLFAIFFAGLAYDAFRFERTSRHQPWSVTPSRRAVGADPLSRPEQEAAQSSRYTGVGGIPGLYRVFVLLSVGCVAGAAWSWLS